MGGATESGMGKAKWEGKARMAQAMCSDIAGAHLLHKCPCTMSTDGAIITYSAPLN